MYRKKENRVGKFGTVFRTCKRRTFLSRMKRSTPRCGTCDINFKDLLSFEAHLQSVEHQLTDSPLEFILRRVENVDMAEGQQEYKDLRRKAEEKQPEPKNDNKPKTLDISSVVIGSECLNKVVVSYCGVCKRYIPEGDSASRLDIHLSSVEHRKNLEEAEKNAPNGAYM